MRKKLLTTTVILALAVSLTSPILASESANSAISQIEQIVSTNGTITSNISDADYALEKKMQQFFNMHSTQAPNISNINLDDSTLNSRDFTLLDLYEDETEQVLTYQVNNTRVTLCFYKDSDAVSKSVVVFDDDGNFTFENNYNNEKTIRSSSTARTLTFNGDEENIELYARGTIVDPHEFDIDKYMYSAQIKKTKMFEFPALADLGLDDTQMVRLYESAIEFEESTCKTGFFDIKESVDVVAAFWNVSRSIAKDLLNAANIAIDTLGYLQEAVEPVREHEYTFYGGIETTVYDPTREKTYVEVLNEWDQGIYTLTWQRVYNGFADATWGISSQPDPWQTSYTEHLENTADLYNAHISKNGVWLLGVGRLGY